MMVLIVEDSRTCAQHLAARLQKPPCAAQVHTEDTIAGARRWLHANKPAMAVVDMALPDGSGLDLLPLLDGVLVVIATATPEDAPADTTIQVIHKGPAWAAKIETIAKTMSTESKST